MTDARELGALVAPSHTAVLTMEMQRGVVSDEALLPALVQEVERAGTVVHVARVCAAARAAGARVVHCTAETRPDGAGAAENCRIFALAARRRRERGHGEIDIGSPGAQLVPELGVDAADILVSRLHGMTPFTSTSLDQILRNLGVRTVVATGVSVNLGLFGMALSAVDLGYHVVLVRDAVAGVPAAYAEAVIENSLSLITTVVTAEEVTAAWAPRPA
jgi:nicotinamidase-related amidase